MRLIVELLPPLRTQPIFRQERQRGRRDTTVSERGVNERGMHGGCPREPYRGEGEEGRKITCGGRRAAELVAVSPRAL
eukprot:801398-Prymnesium_polylepis.1